MLREGAATVVLAVLLAGSARADVPDAERYLASDSVLVGVFADGSFGNPAADVGLRVDPDGHLGPIPIGGDWILPGYVYEVWSASYQVGDEPHSLVCGGPYLPSDVLLAWDDRVENQALDSLHGSGETADFSVDVWVDLPGDEPILWVTVALTAKTAVSDLWLLRAIDPDPDFWTTGSYDAWMRVGGDVASAAADYDGRALAISARGGEAGSCVFCSLPEQLAVGESDAQYADTAMGVRVAAGALSSGQQVVVTWAYAGAEEADAAEALALDAAADDDHDRDGVGAADGDCDDRDPARRPGLDEEADGADNDCDGEVDEDTVASDDDGDGYSERDGDCDDGNALVFPGADPRSDVADADCDGVADDGWPADLPDDLSPEAEPKACGCDAGGGGAALPMLIALAMWRRRARR